ncbi:MAG: tetratricopeptide repeat protein, partial [Flavobacteriales bacterium]|nr:tetratricopeptide repeat protein [Flavobacteriales bacterium]
MAFSRYIMFGYMYSRPDTVPELTRELLDYGRVHDYGIAIAQAHNLDGIANDVQGNYEEALTHYQKALLAYEEAGKIKGAANCLANIAAVYASQGNYAQALEFDQKALARRKEMGDKQGMAGSYNNIGLIQREMGNYPAALRSFMSSSAIFEELGDDRHLSKALGNLGIVYKDQGDLERAKEYYEKALRLKEKVGEQDGESQVLNNLGEIYLRQDNYAKALEYFERSGAIAADVGDKGVHAVSLGNIGATYAEMDRYAEAVAAYEKSLLIKEGIGDKRGVAHAIINIGSIHVESGSTATGLAKCLDGLEQSEELGSIPDMEQACECLYTGYKAIGNAGKALQYFQRFVAYRDSMYNEDNTKEFTRIEMQYDFDKKEAATQAEQEKKDAIAAEELRRQKVVRNGFMGGFALVALFAGIFFTQRNRIGKEKARSEELLLNILPEEVAEELKEKGEADAKLIDQVTVLFTDFKGFTAMSEQLSPKALVKDLHECFRAFDNICEDHGLEKIKTIGDAYMAAGGLPVPNETHAKDA